jgi:hypothetical protein
VAGRGHPREPRRCPGGACTVLPRRPSGICPASVGCLSDVCGASDGILAGDWRPVVIAGWEVTGRWCVHRRCGGHCPGTVSPGKEATGRDTFEFAGLDREPFTQTEVRQFRNSPIPVTETGTRGHTLLSTVAPVCAHTHPPRPSSDTRPAHVRGDERSTRVETVPDVQTSGKDHPPHSYKKYVIDLQARYST